MVQVGVASDVTVSGMTSTDVVGAINGGCRSLRQVRQGLDLCGKLPLEHGLGGFTWQKMMSKQFVLLTYHLTPRPFPWA